MKSKLRLFVFTDFCPDYTSGLAFAIASDEPDARRQIEKKLGYTPNDWGDLTIRALSRRYAEAVAGGG